MHIHLADQYRQGSSFIHQLDPRTKTLVAFLFILLVSLTPFGSWLAYFFLYAFLGTAAILSGVGLRFLLRRSFIAIPFALAAVTLPFTVPGDILITLPLFGGLEVSIEGTIRFISIVIKSWISVQAAILLVTVTPFPDLLWGLRALWIPGQLVAIIGFAYRYLFVLSDEAVRLIRARAARSASSGRKRSGGSLYWRGKIAGRMVGSLMLRSIERSERIHQAMLARGYAGRVLTLSHPKMGRLDYLALLISAIFLVFLVFISRILAG
jgi:cobalt/nickel transport system permease protein